MPTARIVHAMTAPPAAASVAPATAAAAPGFGGFAGEDRKPNNQCRRNKPCEAFAHRYLPCVRKCESTVFVGLLERTVA
jgi:hypothetical protein